MACVLCGSSNEAEFPTEMAFHFSGVHALDKPGIFVYPKVMVCTDCGFPGLQRRKSERAQLLKDVSKRESLRLFLGATQNAT